ncbi:DUF3298 and DUF4163 domain-containing protein [Metabacillus litoralis]|uniref:DUF3298 and DUF4163 domain-containing protein n=1 Tax=Metabacillus litoralis TaxID=152268 RepID=A0A5C6W5L4_9BACI|nr:DUF3298 and DUF4163 domain-containing protein [Metabacillus litoralis]TXC92694.1 DUF3298 and DUF4163 domain-containing protein [Metabacillus litoralis]
MPITLPISIKSLKITSGPKQTVFYPKVMQMTNQQLQRLINTAIVYETHKLINEQVGNMPTTVKEMLGFYEIKNNQRQVLSLTFSNYTYHDQAAHGMTYLRSLTFDLKKGKQCQLRDLFKPEVDYMKKLSEIIKMQMKQRDIPLLHEFNTIKPNQDFYIADKTLVIYFQLYEITPYVFGFPIFPISFYDIQELIDENGPLGHMAVND